MDIHYGSRLRRFVENSPHTVTEITKMMGYADRKSVYELYEKEYFKPEILQKALDALEITREEFLGNSMVSENTTVYENTKKYLEQRVEDLEAKVAALEKHLRKLTKTTSV